MLRIVTVVKLRFCFIWLFFFVYLFLHRQLHVMDETHVINQVKEDVCYVSQDFYKDMEIAKYVCSAIKCKTWYFSIIDLYKQMKMCC